MSRIRAAWIGLIVVGCLWTADAARAGLNVVVVLDDSGSMDSALRSDSRVRKIDAAKRALTAVIAKLPRDAQVGVLALNGDSRGDGKWVYPIGPVDQAKLRAAIRPLRPQGGTPLGARILEAGDALVKLRDKEHYGTYRLLVVSDGNATDGSELAKNLPKVLARGLWVDVIGVDMAAKHSLATKVHSYRKADDPAALQRALEEVLAEIGDEPTAAGESDFEIIAPLPDEMAAAALRALAEGVDKPIDAGGSKQAAPRQDAARPTPAPHLPKPPRPVMPRPPRPAPPGGGFGMIGVGGLLCLGVFLAFVFFVIATANKGRRGRERDWE